MGAPGAVETEEQEINPPVKMRLERSAERDKREIKNNFSADYAQSERGAHSKSSKIKGAGARLCICPFYNYTAP